MNLAALSGASSEAVRLASVRAVWAVRSDCSDDATAQDRTGV